MEHSDRELVCASCSQRFLFSAGEQAYYAQNGLQDPRRCKPCRAQRKAQAAEDGERRKGGQPNAPARGPRGPRPSQAFPMARPDDPNGYRAPAFQSQQLNEYKIDYEGLPRDIEDEDFDAQAAKTDGVDRFGLRTNMKGPAHGAHPRRPGRGSQFPRGINGRRLDRTGTDPDAYRAPAFANSDPSRHRGPNRDRRPQRPRHEATCSDCGADALVPFQPGPDRPAYCKPCYQARKANGTAPPAASGGRPASAANEEVNQAPARIDRAIDSSGK